MSTRHAGVASLLVLGAAMLGVSGCGGAQARKARHLEKGHDYLVAGNYDKARVEFQNALQIAPTDPQARFENGVVNEKLGKVREAAQFYQAAIDVNPDHLEARTNLARLCVFSGLIDRASELIKPALDKHPDDSELLALRAVVRMQQKDVTEARADAERAVQLGSTNEDAIATLAGIYNFTHDTGKAREILERGVQRIPDTVNLRLALAQLYTGENRPADSERILLDLVRLRPSERAQRIRLAQYYVSQSQLDAAEHALRDGVKAIPGDRQLKLSLIDFLSVRRGAADAEKELSSMIAAAPNDPELKFALAKFYESTQKPETAEKIYRDVMSSEGLDAAGLTARDRLADLQAKRNDIPGAEKLIAEVLAKSPRDSDALILRGNIALLQKDPKVTIADMRAVLRDQPNSIPVLRTLAHAHFANGEPAIAEETMRRAVEADPKDARVRLDLAQLLVQLGKPQKAQPILADIVKEDPGNGAALDTLFRVSAAMKDYAAAKTAADAIVASQPKAALGYLYQGMVAEEANHDDEALRLYEKANALQPDSVEPLQAEVRLLVTEKRLPDAMKVLDAAIAGVPSGPLAPNLKGDLLLAQGHAAEARDEFKIAIGRAPKWWLPYRGLARAQMAVNDADAGLATLRDAQATVEQPEQLALELAMYFERDNKPDDAMRQYEEVVRRDPQSELAANNLAMLLVTYKSDSASLDRAKSLSLRFADSANPSFLDTYGWVLYKRGEAAASVPILERVVAKSPDAPIALYHLGMAQSQAGSNEEARENLERAVNSGAAFSGIDEARATLDKLAKLPSKEATKS